MQVMQWYAVGGCCWGSKDWRKRINLALTIYRGFMQVFFNQILSVWAI